MNTHDVIDVHALGEVLNTAVGWLLTLIFVVLLVVVLIDKFDPPRRRKPTNPTEEQRDER